MKQYTHKELVLHAVLLARTVNKYHTKEKNMEMFNSLSDVILMEYIEHFHDSKPDIWGVDKPEEDYYYTPSCTCGDYSPSCPWNAPGMSISDFI